MAEAAGVSKTTVSFVINDTHPQVDAIPVETRERIRACAEALGYRRNPIAASLRTGKPLWIGVMTHVHAEAAAKSLWTCFFELSLLAGIQTRLSDYGYFTLLGSRNAADQERDVELLASAEIGGLILSGAGERAVRKAEGLIESGLPVVNVFPLRKSDLYPNTLDLDNMAAGRMAAELFIKAGARNPAYVTSQVDGHMLEDRAIGFSQTIYTQLGKSPLVCELPINMDDKSGMEILEAFIRSARPDAVAGLDAGISILLSFVVDTFELNVPKDLMVIGFDCSFLQNPRRQRLSSVGASWVQAGEEAAQLIIGKLQDEARGPLPRLIAPIFVPADSTPPSLAEGLPEPGDQVIFPIASPGRAAEQTAP